MIFKNIEGINFKEIIENVPLNKLLIETDCPYLVPEGVKAKRNEPIFVQYIADKIAEVKKISQEELAKITTDNARKFFSI